MNEVKARVIRGFEWVLAQYKGKNVVVGKVDLNDGCCLVSVAVVILAHNISHRVCYDSDVIG